MPSWGYLQAQGVNKLTVIVYIQNPLDQIDLLFGGLENFIGIAGGKNVGLNIFYPVGKAKGSGFIPANLWTFGSKCKLSLFVS